MTTHIYELDFEDNAQINVVKNNDSYTYVCSNISIRESGVMLDYTDSGTTYRTFVPWHQIDRIYQEL